MELLEAISYPIYDPMCAWYTRTARGGKPLQLTEGQLAEAACAPICAPALALAYITTLSIILCMARQDDARRELLQLTEGQLAEVARAANRYPDIQLSYEPSGRLTAAPGETIVLTAALERELTGDLTPVYAPRCDPWHHPHLSS